MIGREIDTQSSCPFAHLFRLADALSVEDVAAQLGIRSTGPEQRRRGQGNLGSIFSGERTGLRQRHSQTAPPAAATARVLPTTDSLVMIAQDEHPTAELSFFSLHPDTLSFLFAYIQKVQSSEQVEGVPMR